MTTYLQIIADEIKTQTQLKLRQNGQVGFAARVENENDEAFWRTIFESILPDKKIEFFPNFAPSSLTKGKTDMLKYLDFADEQLVFCLDADHDYLLENPVLVKSFVFHTYVYAIENYYCFSEGVEVVYKKMLQPQLEAAYSDFDVIQFFKRYSSIIFDFVSLFLFSRKSNSAFFKSIKNLKSITFDKNLTDPFEDLNQLKVHLDETLEPYKTEFETNQMFKLFLDNLQNLGFNKETAYLFVNSHDIFDRLTLRLLRFLDFQNTKSKINDLTEKGKESDISVPSKLIENQVWLDSLKGNNQAYKANFFYQNIESDIKRDFNLLK